jgi:hypothetical protein
MGVAFSEAMDQVQQAAAQVFEADPRVRSLGVGRHGSGFAYVAVRNAALPVPLGLQLPIGANYQGIPVTFLDGHRDPEGLAKVPLSGPASPTVGSLVPEQGLHRPLVCGLQIENLDDDQRTGVIAGGYIIVGTLGCFVTLAGGGLAILSNNHVVAGVNRGQRKADRIEQPGVGQVIPGGQAGVLTDFIALQPSPAGATLKLGTVILNEIDAGVAELAASIGSSQQYLPSRTGVAAPRGSGAPQVGDQVHKVGRTTGLTHGEVKQVGTIVGPLPYAPGPCWFRNSITIEGLNGTMFSDLGDSGSAVVRSSDGEVVGLLFAGNGQQSYACPIDAVLQSLSCAIA